MDDAIESGWGKGQVVRDDEQRAIQYEHIVHDRIPYTTSERPHHGQTAPHTWNCFNSVVVGISSPQSRVPS